MSTALLENRRRFLQFLAASPLLAQPGEAPPPIASPAEALTVLDFEAAAKEALPPAHFGYLATGVDGDATLRANRNGFSRIQLRPRRLVDISKVDTHTQVLDAALDWPVFLCPVGNQKAFHPEGELPVARAARARKTIQVLSTAANTSIEEIGATLGTPAWYQLYPTSRWDYTERLVRRAEDAGSPVLMWTVDTQAGRFTETFERFKRQDKRDCKSCHGTEPEDFYRRKPMFAGWDMKGVRSHNPAQTWEQAHQLRRLTKMKFLIKGIETAEDARLCVEAGCDGIVVSNHGGRAEESGRSTIECLPEVVTAVNGRIPVLIDGGFRRGTDIFKALALGAAAVGIGRPYVWGLGAFGQPGVEKVIEMLRAEFELTMKQCGVTAVAGITRSYVV